MSEPKQVAVLGAGSWGTALALVLAENGCNVTLWSRSPEQSREINDMHSNEKFLPGVKLHPNVKGTSNIGQAVSGKEAIVLAVPSHAVREISEQIRPYIDDTILIVQTAKGLETGSLKRLSQVIGETLGESFQQSVVVLSGPSHAEEVSAQCPTTIVVASHRLDMAEKAQDLFINSYFRVYTNPDMVGVEIGGALKNIIALGAGLSDGLGYGDNAKAALITRGLAEIGRLGMAMGASPLTFSGLAGVGDLIVTCTSRHSRNWRAGHLLGKGQPLEQVLENMGMVVEGVRTTKAAYCLSQQHGVDMPITKELYRVLFEQKPPKAAVEDLMGRVRTYEMEEAHTISRSPS